MALLSVTRRLPLSRRANFTCNLAGKIAYAGSRAFLLIMIAKLGTAEMVGQFSFAFAVTTPVFMIADLDLRSVLVTDFIRQYQFGHYMGLRLLTVVPALITVGLLALCQKSALTGTVILLVGFAKTVEIICDLLYGLMQREERLDKLGLSLILKSVLSILFVGLLLWRFKSIAAGAAGLAAAYLVVLLVYDIRAVRPYGPLRICLDRRILLHLLRLSLPLGIVLLFTSLNKNLSTYFINGYLGPASLGYYTAAVYIMTTGSMAVSALGQSRNARLAKLFGSGDTVSFVRILRNMVMMTGLLGVSMILAAVLFGGNILTLLYTREYAFYQTLFIFIMVAAAVSYIGETVQYAVTATRQFQLQPFAYGLVLLTGLGINPILISRFQLNGAAWSLIITSCLQLGVNTLLLLYMLRNKKMGRSDQGKIQSSALIEIKQMNFPEGFDEHFIDAWRKLRTGGSHTAFSDPDFLSVWWKHFNRGSTPLTLAVYAESHLVGVFPFLLTRGPGGRRCRLIGHPQATQTDIVLLPEYAQECVNAVIDFLDRLKGPVVFEFDGLSFQDPTYAALLHRLKILKRSHVVSKTPCPVIYIRGQTYECYIKSQFSSHTLKNNRRDDRRLDALGSVTCRELTAADMPAAYGLHDARWARKLDTSGFCIEPSRSFFTQLLSIPKAGWQAMALGLFIDGQMIAFQYGFICGSRAMLYKSAHSELLNIYAPGKRMKREFIMRLFHEHLETVDLGVGYEEYKNEWTQTSEKVHGLLFPKRGLRSRLLFIPYSVNAVLRAKLKRHRRLVLFKRNGVGKLKYMLSPRTLAGLLRRFSAKAVCHGLPTLLSEALHIRRQTVLYKRLNGPSENPQYDMEKVRVFDAPELALLLNRAPANIVQGFYKGHDFFAVRRQGEAVFAAEVSYGNEGAEITDCRVHRRFNKNGEIPLILNGLCGILTKNGCKAVSIRLYSGDRKLLRAALESGFLPAVSPIHGQKEGETYCGSADFTRSPSAHGAHRSME